jgi:hypothetical protein
MSSRWISTSFSTAPVRHLAVAVDGGVGRLHQRGLAHAARAPQQRVVGRQALGEAAVFSISVSRARSMPRSSTISTRFTRGRGQPWPLRVPDKGVGGGEVGRLRGRAGASRSSAAAIRCSASRVDRDRDIGQSSDG